MKTLLVIDMLEDFFREGPLKEVRGELTQNINTLIKGCRERAIPVIWIRQEFKDDLSDAFLVMRRENIQITIAGTKGAQILEELDRRETDSEVIKKRYSAFFQTELDKQLKEIGATGLLLAGVNTHACIRTAAIDAYQRDYEVTMPVECVSSYDRNHHEVTLNYINGRIGTIVNLKDVWD